MHRFVNRLILFVQRGLLSSGRTVQILECNAYNIKTKWITGKFDLIRVQIFQLNKVFHLGLIIFDVLYSGIFRMP